MISRNAVRSLVILAIFATARDANAQLFGIGSISGVFEDVITTQPSQNYIIPRYSGAWVTPTSGGGHTNSYTWGLTPPTPRVFYLDGIETPLETINALGLTTSEEMARVSELIIPSTNSLHFTGSAFATLQGQPFVAGHLSYTNGNASYTSNFGSYDVIHTTAVPSVTLEMTSAVLTGGPAFNQTSSLEIIIVTTPNEDLTGNPLDPHLAADFIYFKDRPDLGSFRVFEGESTDVEIRMAFNSLDLVGFGAVSNPAVGFVSPDITVPEPSTVVLSMAIGLISLGARRRRRRTPRHRVEGLAHRWICTPLSTLPAN